MNLSQQRKLVLLSSIMLTCALIFAIGFSILKAILVQQSGSAKEKVGVGIITNDSLTDQSWGSLAYAGQLKIRENFPVEVELISEMKTMEEMRAAALQLIDKGMKLIIGHGAAFSPVFSDLAPLYTDVHFVTINGYAIHPNQTSFVFNPISSDYFAGMIAALMTESNKIAIIDALGIYVSKKLGFFKGIVEFNPHAEVYTRVVGSWDDEEKAALFTKELADLGVDVIFTRGNAFNRAVIHEAEKRGIFVIGFVDDQGYMAKEHVITSIVSDVPKAYMLIMEQYFSDEGLKSGQILLDFDDGVYHLAPFGDMVPESVQKLVEEYLEKYKRGEFKLDELV